MTGCAYTYSQNDTIRNLRSELITDRLEDLTRIADMNQDYNDLIDGYLNLAGNPVNINSDKNIILRDLYLINDNQLSNLKNYISTYGPLNSIHELNAIEGFTEETVVNITPFIKAEPIKQTNTISPVKIARYGTHRLIMRYDRILEKKKGYILPTDSAANHPGSVYLGSPSHYYLRYNFNYRNKIKAGFTLDKDAGEPLLKDNLNDSINQLIGNKINNCYDFISVFAFAEDLSFVKKIVIGDYHLEFGQGLTLWTGLSFGKSSDAVSLTKYGAGIRPNTSANENIFLRGCAATLELKKIWITTFYSSNNIDGNIELHADTAEQITSIIETGMHRTINEILDKKTFKTTAYGGNIQYHGNFFRIGFTGYRTILDKPVSFSTDPWKQFRFNGKDLTNYGSDMLINLSKASLFGELSFSSNGGIAFLAGINTFLHDRFTMSLIYHDYDVKYQNLYCNPMAESSTIINEKGIYLSFQALLSEYISISGYVDYYTFPWLKYQIDGPSHGNEFALKINMTPSPESYGSIRVRFKKSQQSYNFQNNYMSKLQYVNKNDLRIVISYKLTDFLTFKNRADIILFSEPERTETGYMLYHDAIIRSSTLPIDLTFRISLFSTDGYNSRIYTYEHDLLYAFSVPCYFDDGLRWYFLLKWEATKNISIWARYSSVKYLNRETIGSGNEVIDGNRKSDIKAQIILKL